ncbi:MAG: hypothetical protein ACE5R6_12745 [Candidatus Heimdallarchaeota archaeon]
MPPLTGYDSFFDFLTQFFPNLYADPPNLQLPGLGEWLSPFIMIECLADGRVLPPHAAAAEWAARIGWPDNPLDKSCNATTHYRLLVAPVDDFTPIQRLLTAPNLFARKLALFLCLVLSKHPANALTILDLLAHEFVLDSGSYDPAPPDPPQECANDSPIEWLRALFTRPPAARLSLGPTPSFRWDLPVEAGPPASVPKSSS